MVDLSLAVFNVEIEDEVLRLNRRVFGSGEKTTRSIIAWFPGDGGDQEIISVFRTYHVRYFLGIPTKRQLLEVTTVPNLAMSKHVPVIADVPIVPAQKEQPVVTAPAPGKAAKKQVIIKEEDFASTYTKDWGASVEIIRFEHDFMKQQYVVDYKDR